MRAYAPDFLERAAASVVEKFPLEPLLSPEVGMLRRVLADLVQGVRDALVGSDPRPPKHAPVDPCSLLRSLRGEVLDEWSDEDGSLLETLQAFEATERVILAADEGVGANRFSRSLLREVVHLLVSPLGSVVLLAGRLQEERGGPLTEEQQRQVRIIHRAATSAATASSDILTLTTPEEHYRGSRRFSVGDTVTVVADVVRPVTEARGTELIVRGEVERARRGPANGLARALLGLTTRVALMTRNGTVELDVQGGDGDKVSFSLSSRGELGGAHEEGDPFLMFRNGPGSDGYTLSAEALAFSAGRQILRAMGSDLEVHEANDGALTLRFEMTLPTAH